MDPCLTTWEAQKLSTWLQDVTDGIVAPVRDWSDEGALLAAALAALRALVRPTHAGPCLRAERSSWWVSGGAARLGIYTGMFTVQVRRVGHDPAGEVAGFRHLRARWDWVWRVRRVGCGVAQRVQESADGLHAGGKSALTQLGVQGHGVGDAGLEAGVQVVGVAVQLPGPVRGLDQQLLHACGLGEAAHRAPVQPQLRRDPVQRVPLGHELLDRRVPLLSTHDEAALPPAH